jgi:hypothetical protein
MGACGFKDANIVERGEKVAFVGKMEGSRP